MTKMFYKVLLILMYTWKTGLGCNLGISAYRYQGSCYKFVHEHLSWPEAVTYCATMGGELVRIETSEEHNFLIKKVKEIQANDTSFDNKEYWINLSDAIVQGEWMWMGNTRLASNPGSFSNTLATYVKWGPTQPNDFPREDCAGLWSGGGYLYGDWTCDVLHHAICEDKLLDD